MKGKLFIRIIMKHTHTVYVEDNFVSKFSKKKLFTSGKSK